jgi:hypothetical protein
VANRKPLVIVSGVTQQLQSGDLIDAADVENAVTATADFGTDSVLVLTDGTSKVVKDSTISGAVVVTAASAFSTDNLILRSDGTGRGTQNSILTLADTTGRISSSSASFMLLVGSGANPSSAGEDLIIIGSGAGASATIGNNSMLIGEDAGNGMTAGVTTFLLGLASGLSSTFGASNTAFGGNALREATATNFNIAIGASAGQGATMGSQNHMIGVDAGRLLNSSSASFNVFIGGSAGNVSGQKTDAVRTVAIGQSAYTDANNQVVIGSTTHTHAVFRGTVDVVRSTNPCRVNIYNTSASDPSPGTSYERLACWWSSNVCRIETEAGGGGGTTRDLVLGTAGTERMRFGASGRATMSTLFNLGTTTELTIATGVITVTKSYHRVDTEANAASDDLDTINGGSEGDLLVLRAEDGSHTVVVKDGTGNIECAGDFSMDNAFDRITLLYSGGAWVELCRSDNAA